MFGAEGCDENLLEFLTGIAQRISCQEGVMAQVSARGNIVLERVKGYESVLLNPASLLTCSA